MKISKSIDEHRNVILELEGETSQKALFTSQLRDLLGKGYRRFVLDLEKERRIDAAGLGVLVAAWKTIHAAGGELKLTRVSGRTRRVLQVTGLDSIFETYDTPDQAMASFSMSEGLRGTETIKQNGEKDLRHVVAA